MNFPVDKDIRTIMCATTSMVKLLSPIQVSVQWEATPTTAQSADYNPSSGVVTIAHSSMIATLPLSIVDDSEPEFAESLAVSILSVSNGASLGPVGTITVEIERSDDPNGALGTCIALW